MGKNTRKIIKKVDLTMAEKIFISQAYIIYEYKF